MAPLIPLPVSLPLPCTPVCASARNFVCRVRQIASTLSPDFLHGSDESFIAAFDKHTCPRYSPGNLFDKDKMMPSPIRKATISVELQRLDAESQARLDWLLDQNNEGRLTPDERLELQYLVAQYETMLLQNTEAVLRATRPDLVDASGHINRARLARATRRTARFMRQSDSP